MAVVSLKLDKLKGVSLHEEAGSLRELQLTILNHFYKLRNKTTECSVPTVEGSLESCSVRDTCPTARRR